MQLAWSRFVNHASKVPILVAALIAIPCAGCGGREPDPPEPPVSFALHNWCSGAIDVYVLLHGSEVEVQGGELIAAAPVAHYRLVTGEELTFVADRDTQFMGVEFVTVGRDGAHCFVLSDDMMLPGENVYVDDEQCPL